MCGNRVEELEARVQELEASVEGLTDELVECKVRIRELETAVDEDMGFGSPSEEDDIVTADPSVDDGTSAAEATKTEEGDTKNKTEESESDIIVA